MSEHPILFTGEMVRAILEGRKTQTRRIVKPQPIDIDLVEILCGGKVHYRRPINDPMIEEALKTPEYNVRSVVSGLIEKCPYGHVGDRLWVRETCAYEIWTPEFGDMPAQKDNRPIFHQEPENWDDEEFWLIPHYRATDPAPDLFYEDQKEDGPTCRWRPSIHMHRWASRILLEITNIRIERVQDISEEDAVAEGIYYKDEFYSVGVPQNRFYSRSAKGVYPILWDKISAKSGHPWENNDWVWVFEFKVLEVKQ